MAAIWDGKVNFYNKVCLCNFRSGANIFIRSVSSIRQIMNTSCGHADLLKKAAMKRHCGVSLN